MGFVSAIKSCLSQYAAFQGRAPRSEFWFFTLFSFLAQFVLGMVDALVGTPLSLIAVLLLLLPTIAVGVRRLHDIDKSGWWYLIYLVPLVGFILLIVWGCTKGSAGPNRFGADPLNGDAVAVAAAA